MLLEIVCSGLKNYGHYGFWGKTKPWWTMNYWSLMEEEGSMLFVMPSIAQSGDATCIPDLEITNSEDVISFCRNCGVGLVLAEAPLLACLADDLVKARSPTFLVLHQRLRHYNDQKVSWKNCHKYNIPTVKVFPFSLWSYCTVGTSCRSIQYLNISKHANIIFSMENVYSFLLSYRDARPVARTCKCRWHNTSRCL